MRDCTRGIVDANAPSAELGPVEHEIVRLRPRLPGFVLEQIEIRRVRGAVNG